MRRSVVDSIAGSLVVLGVFAVLLGAGACTTSRNVPVPADSGSPRDANGAGGQTAGTGGRADAGDDGQRADGGAPDATGTAGMGGVAGMTGGGTGGMAAPAMMVLDPITKDLSVVVIGHFVEATFQVTNTGGLSTSVPTADLDGTDAAQYAITANACTAAITPGASCLLTVRFTPTTAGLKSTQLNVRATLGGAVTASVQGTGVMPGALTIAPSNQDFGSLLQGQMSAPITFTVTNTGGSATGALATTISDSTELAIVTDGCRAMTLAANATCALTVTFLPMSAGQKSATLSVTASPGGTASAGLTGIGLAPALLSLSPTSATFPGTIVGAASAATLFTIKNNGGVAAGTGTAVAAVLGGTNAGEFAISSNTCTAMLGAGASCVVGVTFNPTSAMANKSATLTVSATPGGSMSATLTGSGLAPAVLSVSPASGSKVDFGSLVINTSATQAFLVSNGGQQATSALTISVAGPDFTISQPPPSGDCVGGATLAANTSCTVHVQFAPATTGSKTSTLSIGATTGGTATAVLTGMAVPQGTLTISPTTQAFGSLLQGTTPGTTNSFSVTNTGGGTTGTLATSITGSTDFAITADSCKAKTLATGAGCSISVTFAPTSAGQKTGTLSVTGTPGGVATSTLSGTGLAPAQLAVTPTIFTYPAGTVANTTSAAQVFTVTNSGGVVSGAVTFILTGTDSSQFGISSSNCTTVPMNGGTCSISVVFQPTSAGTKSATLSVSAGSGTTTTAALGATALSAASLVVAPASGSATNDFGPVVLGMNELETFVVTNMGQQTTTAVTVLVSGSDYAQVTPLVTGDCINATTTLITSATCTVRVRFTPTASGTRTGMLAVSAAVGGSPVLPLTGTGVTPSAISIAPTTQGFGTVLQGTTSVSHTFIVSNSGGAPTGTLSTAITGTSEFATTADTCRGAVLAINGSCSITVVMTPVSPPGNKNATLTVTGNPGGSPTAALSGVGFTAAVLGLSPTSADFGNVAVGSPKDQIFVLSNSGSQMAAGIVIGVAGTGFSLPPPAAGECGTTLAGNSNCNVRVRFTAPGLVGTETGTLTIVATTGTSPTPATLHAYAFGILPVPVTTGTTSSISGMNAAGTIVAGSTSAQGFYWTIGTSTVTSIPNLPNDVSSVGGLSANGLVVAGCSNREWRWTPGSTTATDLNFPPPVTDSLPCARALDTTGATIIGTWFDGTGSITGMFVWRSGNGMFSFPGCGFTNCFASSVSDNGLIVGGGSGFDIDDNSIGAALLWSSLGGLTEPAAPLAGGNLGNAEVISSDGTVIYGVLNNFIQPVRWKLPFTAVPDQLPNLTGTSFLGFDGTNQNGSSAVGFDQVNNVQQAVLWTTGIQSVATILSTAGANLTSYTLTEAKAVSTDGKMLAGNGTLNGVQEAWVARIP